MQHNGVMCIYKEISPEYSLERLMLKLKLQYFGHLMKRVDSLEKTLMLEGIEGRRRRAWQGMRWLDGITDSMDVESEWTPGDGDEQGGLACCDSWVRKESDTTERLNWTEAEAPIFFLPDVKNWLICKDPDAGKDWRWEEKGTTEDEIVGWHRRLNGHEFG